MCGILAVLGCVDNSQAKRSRIIELSRRKGKRGRYSFSHKVYAQAEKEE
uniref:Glutamine amidotransferase type-2 domain-containing protein n=1 Tax=Vitis vinifera TaxID=29760 RepID=F6HD88_VITVI